VEVLLVVEEVGEAFEDVEAVPEASEAVEAVLEAFAAHSEEVEAEGEDKGCVKELCHYTLVGFAVTVCVRVSTAVHISKHGSDQHLE